MTGTGKGGIRRETPIKALKNGRKHGREEREWKRDREKAAAVRR